MTNKEKVFINFKSEEKFKAFVATYREAYEKFMRENFSATDEDFEEFGFYNNTGVGGLDFINIPTGELICAFGGHVKNSDLTDVKQL